MSKANRIERLRAKLLDEQPLLYKTPIDIGFIIDVSSSMTEEHTAVKTHIAGFTQELQEGDEVWLVIDPAAIRSLESD